MQTMPKHIFWPIVVSSSLYATVVTRGQGVVLRWIGGRGHFRSRDKDGGHTIRSAIAEEPLIYANFAALCYRTGVIAHWIFSIVGIGNFV